MINLHRINNITHIDNNHHTHIDNNHHVFTSVEKLKYNQSHRHERRERDQSHRHENQEQDERRRAVECNDGLLNGQCGTNDFDLSVEIVESNQLKRL